MANECPNCGSGEYVWHANIAQHRCSECGAWWYNAECTFVPTRSRPAEVKELPDAEGWWWSYDAETRKWFVIEVDNPCDWKEDRYVRCTPPIIPPPQPEPDADAEKLRLWAHWIGPGSKYNGLTQDDLRRIAADLERLKREPKEAGR